MKITNTPFSHRKVLIISIAIFVVIIVIPIILMATNKPVPQTVTITPTPAYDPFTNGGRAQQGTYSIAYPQNSQNTGNTFNGGSTLIIQPPTGVYPGEPVLDVEAYNSKQNLVQKQMWYLAAGATKSTLSINNMTLQELSNTYQMRTINGNHIKTPTQLRVAYFVQPNALYVFRMYYSSSVSIPEDESLFTDFISSFALNH